MSNVWRDVALGDHVDLVTGFPFKSAHFLDSDDGALRLLRGDNVGQAALRWDGAKHWPKHQAAEYSQFLLEERDVILAMDRPWIEAGLKYAWVRQSDLPCLLVQRVSRLRGTNGLSTDYLRYIIGSQEFTGHVKSITTGVNVPHISAKDIRRFRFRLAPRADQQRIVSILGAYDDLIEVNRQRIALLEEIARRLFEEWFVRFRFPGHNDRTTVEGGSLPEGWEAGIAQDLIDFDPATKVAKDGPKPFIPMNNLSTNTSLIQEIEWKEGNSGAKFRNDDTLFARITPCLENGKTGLVRGLPGDGVGFGSTEFIVMRGRKAGPAFCYLLARYDAFREHARRSMSGATGRQRARTEYLRAYHLNVPPASLLKQFEEIAWPLLELSGSLGAANKRLATSRDLLLPRLISGELSVTSAEHELEAVA